ncbi:MAG: O-antigen ligase family protein [Eubacterium sp.]
MLKKIEMVNGVSAALAFIAGAIPLLIIPAFGDPIYMPKIFLVYVIVFGLLLYYLRPLITFFEKRPTVPLPVKWLLIYLLLITITLPFSIDIMHSLRGRSFRLESFSAILFYGILMILGAFFYRFKKWHMQLYAVGVSLIAIYGIFQRFGLDFLPQDPLMYGGPGSSYATIGNPNFLGSFLTLALPMMAYAFMKMKVYYLLPSGLVYFCLLCTNTRGAWIGSFCGIFLLGVFLFKENKKRLVILILMLALLTILYFTVTTGFIDRLLSTFIDFFKIMNHEESSVFGGSNRIFIWYKVVQLIQIRPFTGFGIENLDKVMELYFHQDIVDAFGMTINIDKAHNEYLHIAVCSGIPAALAYLSFEISVLVGGFKQCLKKDNFCIPLVCSVLGYIIASFFNISVVSVAPVFFIFCGILVKQSRPMETICFDS